MVVKVEGKEHREGVSKAGRNYNFNVLHFMGRQAGVEGLAAITKIVDTSVISYDDILVGQHYELEPDFNGNIISVHPAKA